MILMNLRWCVIQTLHSNLVIFKWIATFEENDFEQYLYIPIWLYSNVYLTQLELGCFKLKSIFILRPFAIVFDNIIILLSQSLVNNFFIFSNNIFAFMFHLYNKNLSFMILYISYLTVLYMYYILTVKYYVRTGGYKVYGNSKKY